MKKMKFRVKDEKHSEEIQKALFEQGYKWSINKTDVENADAPYLFVSYFGDNEITYALTDTTFTYSEIEEHFVVNGKIYDKEPLWILHGEPVFEDTVIQWNGGEDGSTDWKDHGNILGDYFSCKISLLRAFQEADWRENYYRVKPSEAKPAQEKRISLEQFVDNVLESDPSIKEITTDVVAVEMPPLGLRPRNIASQSRLLEVLEAVQRYVQAGKEIPDAWLEEMDELIDGKYYVI